MPPKGMRFWLPNTYKIANQPFKDFVDPWHKVPNAQGKMVASGVPGEITFENIMYKGNPLYIRGEIWIDDVAIARQLITKPIILRFSLQDAVDNGFMSVEEAQKRDPNVVAREGVEVIKSKPIVQPEPDLDTMDREELIEYAGEKKLNLDIRLGKPKMLIAIRNALEEGELKEKEPEEKASKKSLKGKRK